MKQQLDSLTTGSQSGVLGVGLEGVQCKALNLNISAGVCAVPPGTLFSTQSHDAHIHHRGQHRIAPVSTTQCLKHKACSKPTTQPNPTPSLCTAHTHPHPQCTYNSSPFPLSLHSTGEYTSCYTWSKCHKVISKNTLRCYTTLWCLWEQGTLDSTGNLLKHP